MTEISDQVRKAVELSTVDIAIGAQKLDELCALKGGSELAYYARREVKKLEYQNIPTIEAIHRIYRLVATDKL